MIQENKELQRQLRMINNSFYGKTNLKQKPVVETSSTPIFNIGDIIKISNKINNYELQRNT